MARKQKKQTLKKSTPWIAGAIGNAITSIIFLGIGILLSMPAAEADCRMADLAFMCGIGALFMYALVAILVFLFFMLCREKTLTFWRALAYYTISFSIILALEGILTAIEISENSPVTLTIKIALTGPVVVLLLAWWSHHKTSVSSKKPHPHR